MPAAADQHVAGMQVLVAGAELDPALRDQLIEVRVRDSLLLPDSALVRISDPQGEKVDTHPLQLGKDLEIRAAAMHARTTTTLFKGVITAVEPDFTPEGCIIAVRAYDRSHALHRTRKVRTFQNQSADNMVRKLASEAGLTASVRPTGVVHEFFQQSNETDWEFGRRLALKHDFEFLVEDRTLHFRPAASAAGAPVTLAWGDGLLSFRPRVTGTQQVGTVEVRAYGPRDKRPIVGTAASVTTSAQLGIAREQAKNALHGGKVLVADRVAETKKEADELARSTLARTAEAFAEAEGTAHGDPRVKAGAKVKIDKVGTRFSGEYVITTSTHVYRGGRGYQTQFTISGRSPRSLLDLMNPPQPREWSNALVVGIVTNNNDPQQLGRVRVKYPSLSDTEESGWARIATLGAGNQRGALMLPQVGEEVVIGFEHGDTRRPMVLGSLFNGRDKPGTDLLQNRDGSFAVKSDKKIWQQSKENFEVYTDKDLTIEVKGNETAKVTGNLDHQATGDGKLKANGSYTIEAGTSITIKGSASVSVEASGPLKLKGATVDIQGSGPVNIKGAVINLG